MSKVKVQGEVLIELQDGDVDRHAFSSEGEISNLESVIDSAIGDLGSIQRMIERRQENAEMLADEAEIED